MQNWIAASVDFLVVIVGVFISLQFDRWYEDARGAILSVEETYMSLQDWGAIGDLAGAIAVIATLIYLTIQIRQYTHGMNSATFHASMQGFNQINMMLVADPALADTYDRGMRDPDSVSNAEQTQVVWLMRSYVNIYENLYQQFKRGACPESYWQRYALELKQTLDSPGGKKFRESNRTYVDLYAYVDTMPAITEVVYDFAFGQGNA
jgi:hypothetical protein